MAIYREASYIRKTNFKKLTYNQILYSLTFIYQDLSYYYRELNYNTILLNRDGYIKLDRYLRTGLIIIRLINLQLIQKIIFQRNND